MELAAPEYAEVEPASGCRHRLLHHIINEAIYTKRDTLLLSPSGKPISWLLDVKGALLRGTAMEDMANLFWDEFGGRWPFQVGGMEMAAIPIVAAIVMKGAQRGYPVNGFIVRKSRKSYGLGRIIEGRLTDERIVVVDDITNSGKSLEKVRVVLDGEGKRISEVFSVVDFNSRAGKTWRTEHGIPVAALFTPGMLGLKLNSDGGAKNEGGTEDSNESRFDLSWSVLTTGGNPYHVVPKSTPVEHNSFLYFGSDAGIFRCVNAADGAIKWEFKVLTPSRKGIWSIPTIVGDYVVFGAYDGNVYCLNQKDGEVVWVNYDADWVGSSPAYVEAHNAVFIGLEFERPGLKGALVSLDAHTGEKRWQVPTREYLHGSPCFDSTTNSVIVGTNDNTVIAVDAGSGLLKWTFNAGGAVKHRVSVDEKRGVVVFGSFDDNLYCVDIGTGRELFRVPTGNVIYSTPLIVEKRIFVGSASKRIFVIDIDTGRVEKTYSASSKVLCSPSLIEGRVYIGANDGKVIEIDPTSLKILGSVQVPDAVTNAVTYSQGERGYIVCTAMNQLYAFKRRP